jgi:DNA-binding transcriptional LysR family regulator
VVTVELELRHLRRLVTIADAGDLGGAARASGVAPAEVAAQLASIERRLGTPVFVRSPTGLVPTGRGREVIALARGALDEVETLFAEARAGGSRLRLIGSEFLLTPAVARFSAGHPDVVVTVAAADPPDVIDAMRSGAADVAATIRWPHAPWALPEQPAGVYVHEFASLPVQVLLPAGHRLAGSRVIDLVELSDEVWCVKAGAAATALARESARHGFEADIRYRLGGDDAVREFVAGGRGVSLVAHQPTSDPRVAVRHYRDAALCRWLVLWPSGGGRPDLVPDLIRAVEGWNAERAWPEPADGEQALGSAGRPLRIGTVTESAGAALLPRLRTMHGVHGVLRTGGQQELLDAAGLDELDLVYCHRYPFLADGIPAGWPRRVVALAERLVVAISVRHRFAGDRVPLAALAEQRWAVRAVPPDEAEVVRALCAEAGFTPEVAATYSDPRQAVPAAGDAQLIRLADPHVTPPGTLLVAIDHPRARRDSLLVWRPGHPAGQLAALVVEELRLAGRTDAVRSTALGKGLTV